MKNLSLIFCAALLLAACQKSGTPATGEETLAGPVTANPEKAQLYIRVETAGSKAALPIDENAVDDVQILLFGSDGKLETYAREDGSELSMKCTLGPKSIYAFVNMPSLENIRTETEVAGIVFSLEHTTASHLPMQGVVRQSVSTSGNLNILVQRMVCKISIREILTAFPEAYTDARLEIDKIYLTNAVSAIDGDGNIRAWANKLTEQNEYPQMLCDDFAESKIIGGSEDGTLGNIFFAFANATDIMRVGTRNAEAVKQILRRNGIKVIAEDTGGNYGRTVQIDLNTGVYKVKTIDRGEKDI